MLGAVAQTARVSNVMGRCAPGLGPGVDIVPIWNQIAQRLVLHLVDVAASREVRPHIVPQGLGSRNGFRYSILSIFWPSGGSEKCASYVCMPYALAPPSSQCLKTRKTRR